MKLYPLQYQNWKFYDVPSTIVICFSNKQLQMIGQKYNATLSAGQVAVNNNVYDHTHTHTHTSHLTRTHSRERRHKQRRTFFSWYINRLSFCITPWSSFLLQKLILTQLVMKYTKAFLKSICFTFLFFYNAPFQFTLLKLRPLIFGLTLFGWFLSRISFHIMELSFSNYAHFPETQLGPKARPWFTLTLWSLKFCDHVYNC